MRAHPLGKKKPCCICNYVSGVGRLLLLLLLVGLDCLCPGLSAHTHPLADVSREHPFLFPSSCFFYTKHVRISIYSIKAVQLLQAAVRVVGLSLSRPGLSAHKLADAQRTYLPAKVLSFVFFFCSPPFFSVVVFRLVNNKKVSVHAHRHAPCARTGSSALMSVSFKIEVSGPLTFPSPPPPSILSLFFLYALFFRRNVVRACN